PLWTPCVHPAVSHVMADAGEVQVDAVRQAGPTATYTSSTEPTNWSLLGLFPLPPIRSGWSLATESVVGIATLPRSTPSTERVRRPAVRAHPIACHWPSATDTLEIAT